MKTNTKKMIVAMMLFATPAALLSSCTKDDSDTTDGLTASLSFVNSVEGSAAQDIYINDAKMSASAVAYGSTSSNISSTTGSQALSFRNSTTAVVSAAATVNLEASNSYSVFLVKQADGSLAVNTYTNDNAAVSGKAKVRFINVAPLLSGAVNVATTAGTNLISALAFKAASAYQTVDSNTSLNVTMTGSLETTTIAGSELQAGKIYTIWFDSSTTTKVKYHVVVQN